MKFSNLVSQMIESKRTQPPHNNYGADGTLYNILAVGAIVWCGVEWWWSVGVMVEC